jgi:hypothetical protein
MGESKVANEQKRYLPECVRCWRCLLVGIAAFVVPLIAFVVVSHALWDLLPKEWFDTRTLTVLDFKGVEFVSFARDVNGRMNFSVMSVAIWTAAGIAVVISFVAVYRNISAPAAAIVVAIGIGVGAFVAHTQSSTAPTECETPSTTIPPTVPVPKDEGFRFVVIDNVMCVVDRQRPAQMAVLRKMQETIVRNSYTGFAGAGAVLAALAVLAMRYGAWANVANLRRRLDDFRTLTLIAGVLFVLNALVTKALVSWTEGMLSANVAPAFAPLGNTLLEYWAAQSSTVFFAAVALVAVFIQLDIRAAATANLAARQNFVHGAPSGDAATGADDDTHVGPGAKPITEAKWRGDNELSFDTATVISAAIGTIAPLLTGPAVDLLSRALH